MPIELTVRWTSAGRWNAGQHCAWRLVIARGDAELVECNVLLQQSAHSREMFGAMPLHERGLRSYGRLVNPGGIAFAGLRSVKSCRQETAGLAAVDENGRGGGFCRRAPTPVITGDSRISERLAHSTLTSPKVRLTWKPRNAPNRLQQGPTEALRAPECAPDPSTRT